VRWVRLQEVVTLDGLAAGLNQRGHRNPVTLVTPTVQIPGATSEQVYRVLYPAMLRRIWCAWLAAYGGAP
jgi:hypothetical protein